MINLLTAGLSHALIDSEHIFRPSKQLFSEGNRYCYCENNVPKNFRLRRAVFQNSIAINSLLSAESETATNQTNGYAEHTH